MKYLSMLFAVLFLFSNQAFAAPEASGRMDPKSALDRLMKGNERYLGNEEVYPQNHQTKREASVAKQNPFAIVLGCSDSRMPPELVFDQSIGDIFSVRIAGNVVGETELDSVEFSSIYLGSSIIMVLGHQNCGAVEAVLANNTKDIENIAKHIEPAVKKGDSLVKATEDNIRNSVKRIKASAPIAKLIKEGKIDVVGAYYELSTGKVRLLDQFK